VRFQRPHIGQARRKDVQTKYIEMLVGRKKCILKVSEEGVAHKVKAVFDKGVQKTGMVEEVGHSDHARVGATQFQLWTIRGEFVNVLSYGI
jgi:hypothetical protein